MRVRSSSTSSALEDAEIAELEATRLLERIRNLPKMASADRSRNVKQTKRSIIEAFASGESALLGIGVGSQAQEEIDIRLSMERTFGQREHAARSLSPVRRLHSGDYSSSRHERTASMSERTEQLYKWGIKSSRKLDTLIDKALEARAGAVAAITGVCYGCAVETRGGYTFTGSNVEASTPSNSVSAERMALLRALTDGKGDIVRLVLAWNLPAEDGFPNPDGASRQFMAELGDFEVVMVSNDDSRSTECRTTSQLLPQCNINPRQALTPSARSYRSSSPSPRGGGSVASVRSSFSKQRGSYDDVRLPVHSAASRIESADGFSFPRRPVRDWGVSQVLEWLDKSCDMPSYMQTFEQCSVDGTMLLQLSPRDMQDMLGVVHPLHLQKLLRGVEERFGLGEQRNL
jgi:cytidine deaminase